MKKVSLPINLWFAACILSAVFGTHGCASTKAAETAITQSRKEASIDAYEQNAASIETLRADSVIIVKYDTIAKEKTLVKYYGIEKTKTDTVFIASKSVELKIDTVYKTEKISEKSEEPFAKKMFDAFIYILIFGGFAGMIWGIRK